MGGEGQVVARKLVEYAIQTAARYDGRRLLFERSGRSVAGIGQERFSGRLAFGVEAVERGVGHQDFTPDFEVVGPVAVAQHEGYRAHRADVGRHVVALLSVAARHGAQQPPVFVGERDGRAVELQFAGVIRRADLALDALDELVELVERVGVAQRAHRIAVAHGAELACEVAAHALRRRVGIGELGMRRLQLLELAHHGVELEVADLR